MIFKEALKSFFSGRTRTLLTIISIAIGVASVIIVNSISETGKSIVNTELDALGLNGIILYGDNDYSVITQSDIDNLNNIEGVSCAMPLLMKSGDFIIFNKERHAFFYGMSAYNKQIFDLKTVCGRNFSKSELKSGGNVCQIDKELALELFKREDVSGKQINILKDGVYKEYEIIGTVEKGSVMLENFLGEYIPSFLYLPLSEMETLSNGYKRIAINIDKDYDYDAVSNKILEVAQAGKSNTFSVKVNDLSSQRVQLTNMMDIVTAVLTIISGISLAVSGLGIMTIMIISVNERKGEIGIKKAIGATSGRILFSFLIESGLVALIGGGVGSFIGIILMLCAGIIGGLNVIINYLTVLQLIILSAMIGMIFGAYPAYKAAKLKPVDALRRD